MRISNQISIMKVKSLFDCIEDTIEPEPEVLEGKSSLNKLR